MTSEYGLVANVNRLNGDGPLAVLGRRGVMVIVAALLFGCWLSSANAAEASATDRQTVVLVVGAEGEPQFGRLFSSWADRWEGAARQADATLVRIGRDASDKSDRELLAAALAHEVSASNDTLWLVLIGHGTFDGRTAKFNLRGPDLAATDLVTWLSPCTRPVVVINCASCSGPFLPALSGANRVVITATRSGNERNFARFGEYLASAISDSAADLDKDGQTSVLEAYLQASHQLAAFYDDQSRLATEHPLLDDNGDTLGTPADWFRGTRAVKAAKDGARPDGVRANQLGLVRGEEERQLSTELRTQRDALEQQLAKLRETRSNTDDAIYYQQLEVILRQLAELYERTP